MAEGADPAAGASARFGALRERFRAGLVGRWAAIVQAADDAPRRAGELHRLAGAAGIYGFGALGVRARQAERLAGDPAGAPPGVMEAVLAALGDEVARVASGAPPDPANVDTVPPHSAGAGDL